MRSVIFAVVSLVLFGLIVSIGCSSSQTPTVPAEPFRNNLSFVDDAWEIWQSGTPTQKYQNIDLSVLVYGPDPPIGQQVDYPVQTTFDFLDRHWTIAVTVEQNFYGDPTIKYAWLDDIENPSDGPPIASGSIYSASGSYYEIAAAKVATCYFSHYGGEDTVDATVAFMRRAKTGLDTDWEIGAVTGTWDVEGFPAGACSTDSPVFWDDTEHPNDAETNDYHPDIAYDPATGDIHLVWTGYTGDNDHPYRLNYVRYDHDTETWGDQEMVYEDDKDYAAWAPRIAIGNAGGDFGQVVGIVYNSYSSLEGHYAQNKWHVGAAYWDVDTGDPENADFIHFSYDDEKDAGFPRLDLAPRNCDSQDACGSIVFEQFYDWDDDHPIFHIIEINNVRDAFWLLDLDQYNDEGFFGAVSIHYPDGDPEATLSYFHQYSEDAWLVKAGRYELDSSTNTWATIPDSSVTGNLTYDDFIDFLTIDTFQACDIVTIFEPYTWDNAYWLGFCDKVDSGAVYVKVAFGDTT